MGQFFAEGGFGMFPTAIFGLFFFALAVLHAMRPDRKLGTVVVLLGAITIGAGLLGLCMGLSSTTRYLSQVPPADQLIVFAAGTSESLNNLILALLVFIPSGLVGAIGAYRASRRISAAVAA